MQQNLYYISTDPIGAVERARVTEALGKAQAASMDYLNGFLVWTDQRESDIHSLITNIVPGAVAVFALDKERTRDSKVLTSLALNFVARNIRAA